MTKLIQLLGEHRNRIDQALDQLLPLDDGLPSVIHEAMRYSVFAGGKRLRPILVLETAKALGGQAEQVMPAACAVECIHTYSLIHDDLPAMDNDDYRRGKPTNHKVYGEAIAILAGDALLTEAFSIMSRHQSEYTSGDILTRAIAELSYAAGSRGMIGGQTEDIRAERCNVADLERLQYIHANKTGALITVSVRLGAILSGCSSRELANVTSFADKLGVAFQIRDDILDIEGDEALVGKTLGKDRQQGKLTYPALVGIDQAREEIAFLLEAALTSINFLQTDGDTLVNLARFLVEREY